jgi:hypothetical protein
VTPGSIVLAAALVSWGPIAPAPGPESPVETAEPTANETPPVAPAAEAVPSPPPAAPAPIQPAIIAKAPIVVRAAPAPVPRPPTPPTERGKLQSRWWFWAIAGGLFAGVLAVTIVETRPGPQAYGGNTPPYTISFP